MSKVDLVNILNSNEFHGSFDYICNDSWEQAIPFEFIIYGVIVGSMIKVVLQYLLRKYTKLDCDFSLWLPSTIIGVLSFLVLFGLFSNKTLFAYVIVPSIIAIALVICEGVVQKGIKEFGWDRKNIV